MKAVVVYDSFFGNTEKVAQAVAGVLRGQAEVSLARVGDIRLELIQGADLLVVGSPTRGFRPTKPVAAWLDTLTLQGVRCAAFDTRMVISEVHNLFLTIMVKIFGYAAEPIAKSLQKKGGVLVLPVEGFFVKGSQGPLKDGELERAEVWAGQILAG